MNDEWTGEDSMPHRADPDCYICHGSGIQSVWCGGTDDYEDIACDCTDKYAGYDEWEEEHNVRIS